MTPVTKKTKKKPPEGCYRVDLTFSRWKVGRPIPVLLPDLRRIDVTDNTLTITDAAGQALTEDLANLSGIRLTIFER